MQHPNGHSLWDLTAASGLASHRSISQSDSRVLLAGMGAESALLATRRRVEDKSIMISCRSQLLAVQALLQLDGVVRRILLCPPDLRPEYVPAVIQEAEVDAIVSDGTGPAANQELLRIDLSTVATGSDRHRETQWLLFTSGTTGRPKIVVHTLRSLTGPLDDGLAVAPNAVWSTFYDIRRYGGLQILLRALLGGGSMVLSQADEPVSDFLIRAGQSGVTHISGTPSHWRRALMTAEINQIEPAYVRLSGEVADQAILNRLATVFPKADIAHAFASTEAGVAFDVRDRLAGFPASIIGGTGGKAEMRVRDGSLQIRSTRTASRYLGDGKPLADADGFVDTGDLVELRNDRYYFIGRREGIINVGGQKVHPEEIEAVINHHHAVQMSRVRGRRSPITGALVVADILLRQAVSESAFNLIKQEILEACRLALAAFKVPTELYRVESLDVSESGKLQRYHA